MTTPLTPLESNDTEALRSIANALDEQIKELQRRRQPFTDELRRRECEENPFLEKLRNGAEITEKWIPDYGVIFYVDGAEYSEIDDDDDRANFNWLSALSDCPQVERETLKHRHYGSLYRLKIVAPTVEGETP